MERCDIYPYVEGLFDSHCEFKKCEFKKFLPVFLYASFSKVIQGVGSTLDFLKFLESACLIGFSAAVNTWW